MQTYNRKFIKTANGWFRKSVAGTCDKCGMYKEINMLCNEGRFCDECAKEIQHE